jgi:hypothetical protein
MLGCVNDTPALQLRVNMRIDLCAQAVIWRDHKRAFWGFCILLGHRSDAFAMIFDFVNVSLQTETLNGFMDLAPRKLFDYFFQLRVFLPHDLFEPARFHSCFLKLSKRPPGFHEIRLNRRSTFNDGWDILNLSTELYRFNHF